jgi:hypothetical protein
MADPVGAGLVASLARPPAVDVAHARASQIPIRPADKVVLRLFADIYRHRREGQAWQKLARYLAQLPPPLN